MTVRRAVLMCGPSFSGKSTLARRIEELTGAAVVSLDEINARRGLSGGFSIGVGEWARSHEIARTELEELFVSGRACVVVDDTNCYRFLRDAFRAVAGAHGAETFVVVPDSDATLVLRRAENETAEATRRGVEIDSLRRQIETFEWPDEDEASVRLLPGHDADAWILENLTR